MENKPNEILDKETLEKWTQPRKQEPQAPRNRFKQSSQYNHSDSITRIAAYRHILKINQCDMCRIIGLPREDLRMVENGKVPSRAWFGKIITFFAYYGIEVDISDVTTWVPIERLRDVGIQIKYSGYPSLYSDGSEMHFNVYSEDNKTVKSERKWTNPLDKKVSDTPLDLLKHNDTVLESAFKAGNDEQEQWRVWNMPYLPKDKYFVSNHGRIKRKTYLTGGRVVKGGLCEFTYPKTKYEYCKLSVQHVETGITVSEYVHRIVAMVWLDDWNPELTVNHIDENHLNNRVDNLEMMTQAENNAFGTRNERAVATKIKNMIPDNPQRGKNPAVRIGDEVFKTKKAAAESLGVHTSTLRKYIDKGRVRDGRDIELISLREYEQNLVDKGVIKNRHRDETIEKYKNDVQFTKERAHNFVNNLPNARDKSMQSIKDFVED